MEYYWELEQFDGTKTQIPPHAVGTVKRRWDENQPIHLNIGSIPANQIKKFTPTDVVYSKQILLDDVSRIFNEPMINDDGHILCVWVKKNVTQAKYDKYYAPHIGYKRLGDFNGMVTVAFRLPIHAIDLNLVEFCDTEEIERLNNRSI